MANKKFAVIGMGEMGLVIAQNLVKREVEVIAIDKNPQIIDSIGDEVSTAVALDATDKKALLSQNIDDCDAVVVLINSDFEQNLLCCTLLLEMGVKRIITRVKNSTQDKIMKKLGITETLSVEDEMGKIVLEMLLNKSIVSYFQLTDNYEVVEIIPPHDVIDKTIGEVDFRKKYNVSLLTVKKRYITERTTEDLITDDTAKYKIYGIPDEDMFIKNTDRLILFGRKEDIEKFIELNK